MENMVLQVHEIGYTYKKLCNSPEPLILDSNACFEFIRPYFRDYHGIREAMYAIYLNRKNSIIGVQRVSEGGVSGTPVDIKLILKGAIGLLASNLLLVHNHPSGELSASRADKSITDKTKQACKLMDLELIDHLILGSDTTYYSFADEGLL